MKYPEIKKLYKYMAVNENTISSLITNSFWFSRPGFFNDPLDCGFDIHSEIETGTEDFLQQVMKYLAEMQHGQNREYILELTQKNDPESIEVRNKSATIISQACSNAIKETVNNFGIFSLSEINNNILMWSHYANQHKGICVEFDRTSDSDLNELAQPVRYAVFAPVFKAADYINATSEARAEIVKSLTLSKANDWAYEREWRLMKPEGNQIHLINARITRIIFGFRMQDAHKVLLKKITAMTNNQVIYAQAKTKHDQFGIDIFDL